MKRLIIFLPIIILLGCQTQKVREEDLNSWRNRNSIELEKHPIFSALPREERNLENGERLINFVEKRIVSDGPSNCVGVSSGFGYYGGGGFGLGSKFCNNRRQLSENNCVHQFSIQGNKVVSYKVLGEDCFTTCKHQPDPNQCKK